MTFVVLFILAVVWALYLASWLRNRAHARQANSISSFSEKLSVLKRAQPDASVNPPALRAVGANVAAGAEVTVGANVAVAPIAPANPRIVQDDPLVRPPRVRGLLSGPPVTRQDARRRRRHVLTCLFLAATLAFAGAALLGGVFTYVAMGIGTVVIAYLFLLLRSQRLAAERAEKVHYLHQGAVNHEYHDQEYYDLEPMALEQAAY